MVRVICFKQNFLKSSANYLFNGIIIVTVAATVARIKLAFAHRYSEVNLTPHRTQCALYLHGKQFPSIRNKTTYFLVHISISEFVIPLCFRYQVAPAIISSYSTEEQYLTVMGAVGSSSIQDIPLLEKLLLYLEMPS